MNKGWSVRLLAFVFLPGSLCIAKADGWLRFLNAIGATPIYVYQRNGDHVKAPFVAQLYLLKDDWVAITPPVAFRTTGIFVGDSVTIPGKNGGDTVTVKVQIWDGARYGSYQEALAGLSNCGESQPFTVTLTTPPAETPARMVNFQPFTLSWDDSWTLNRPKSFIAGNYAIQEGESLPVGNLPGCYPWSPMVVGENIRSYNYGPSAPLEGHPQGLLLGTLQGNPMQLFPGEILTGPPFTYVPKPNVYGTDMIYFGICCELCEGANHSGAYQIDILPSANRQKCTLLLSEAKKPVLLGLNAHHYRIDRSTDLGTWEPAGAVTGNYSTVDLSSFVTAGASAHFLRATDVTTP